MSECTCESHVPNSVTGPSILPRIFITKTFIAANISKGSLKSGALTMTGDHLFEHHAATAAGSQAEAFCGSAAMVFFSAGFRVGAVFSNGPSLRASWFESPWLIAFRLFALVVCCRCFLLCRRRCGGSFGSGL